ncbi:MAG: precorrin-3B C(17)-methyltransferase, partial [Alkalinema sp. CAN_BIN05]|nr:precorrin-3B C(17)-methyltransferase [Alkalinema sp. CAN_BIN05]
PEWRTINLQICPGISAMQAAAARIGAPLGHDFCAISLSDILKPWSVIEQRLTAAAQADFVMAFYNPISTQRRWQLDRTKELLLQFRSATTPVILARNVGRSGELIRVTTLGELNTNDADMRTVIIVGSSQTRILERSDHDLPWVYTPRRYQPE